MNYYNEFDPKAAQWLRNLIDGGKIPQGHVDERSITEVEPDELKRYTQCHFFAGIAGWSYALELAGWPTDRPIWTGSCPCQPFSTAGRQKGQADERHLWPVWFDLIRQCRPDVVMGEQVAAAVGHGWLDGVFTDLEGEGYTCGAAIVPACAVNAPHRRERLWFVADTKSFRCDRRSTNTERERPENEQIIEPNFWGKSTRPCALGYTEHDGPLGGQVTRSNGQTVSDSTQRAERTIQPSGASQSCNVADIPSKRLEGATRQGVQRRCYGFTSDSHWSNTEWLECPDGKQRRIEPTIPLLAHGVSARVVKLRAYGNAIVPQVAAQIIKAYLEVENDQH